MFYYSVQSGPMQMVIEMYLNVSLQHFRRAESRSRGAFVFLETEENEAALDYKYAGGKKKTLSNVTYN